MCIVYNSVRDHGRDLYSKKVQLLSITAANAWSVVLRLCHFLWMKLMFSSRGVIHCKLFKTKWFQLTCGHLPINNLRSGRNYLNVRSQAIDIKRFTENHQVKEQQKIRINQQLKHIKAGYGKINLLDALKLMKYKFQIA